MDSSFRKEHKVYKKLREQVLILGLWPVLAFLFLGILVVVVVSIMFKETTFLALTIRFFIVCLIYVFFFMICHSRKKWEVISSKDLPNELNLNLISPHKEFKYWIGMCREVLERKNKKNSIK